MTTFRLTIVFSGVNFEEDDVFEALGNLSTSVVWRTQDRYAFATAVVDAASALKAADWVTQEVSKLVPSARPIRLDDDLVAIPDIAARIGVTREAVRNWANGTRHANFPLPRGIVGDGIKVWAWSDVNAWLRCNLHLGDQEEFPSAHDVALINALFPDESHRQSATALALPTWNVAERTTASTATRTLPSARRPASWEGTEHTRVHLTVIRGGLYAAA